MKLTIAIVTILVAIILSIGREQTPGDKEHANSDSDSMSGIGNQ